jgi:hypothetical protein
VQVTTYAPDDDTGTFSVILNAWDWFEQASDSDIRRLIETEFEDQQILRDKLMAYYARDPLHEVYVPLQHYRLGGRIEVLVDYWTAAEWVRQRRPDLAHLLSD